MDIITAWQKQLEGEYESTFKYIDLSDIKDFVDRNNVAVIFHSMNLYLQGVRISILALDGQEYGWLITGVYENLVLSAALGAKGFPIPTALAFDEMWPDGISNDTEEFEDAVSASEYIDAIFSPDNGGLC